MHSEIDPSGRFQLRSRGELQLPGSCMICGSGTKDEGYLDFGVFVDYHGTLYFCMTCLGEAAITAGFMSPEMTQEVNKTVEGKLTELAELKKELEDANNVINSLRILLSSKLVADPVTDDVGAVEPEVKLVEQPDAPSPFAGTAGGKSKPAKPVKVT